MPCPQFTLRALLVAMLATGACSRNPATTYKLDTSTVTVYRLDTRHVKTDDDAQSNSSPKEFHGWPIAEETVVANPKLAGELSAAIKNPDHYGGQAPNCFIPGMGVTFGSGAGQVDVVICLKCNQLYSPDSDEYRALNGRGVRELARLYVAVFPAEADKVSE